MTATAYYVYRWRDLGDFPLSKLRKIAEVWGINHQGLSKAALRRTLMQAPQNLSPVPHPLIDIPVE